MARIITDVSAEAVAKKFLPPVSTALLSWHFLNGSLEKAARNYALNRPDASVVGTPVASANYVSFKSLSNFLQTQHEETTSGTFFLVARTTDTLADVAHRPMFFGTFTSPAAAGGGSTFGVSMAATAAASIAANAARGTSVSDDGSYPATLTTETPSNWSLYSMTVSNVEGTKLTNETTGATVTSGAGVNRFRSTGKHRIGSGFGTYEGTSDIALWAAYGGILNAGGIADTVAMIRAYMAPRSIAV